MKTIITILIATGISVSSFAQNLTVKPFPQIDFNKGWKNDTTLTFKNSPRLKLELPRGDFNFPKKFQREPLENQKKNLSDLPDDYTAYQFRMPVVGRQQYSRMPVVVPDSTVHYFLKIKKIPFVNPLDRRWK